MQKITIVSPFLRPLLGHPSPQKGQKLSTSMPAAALAVLRTLVMTRLGVITSLPQMTCRPFCGPYILPWAKHPALRSTRDYRPRSFRRFLGRQRGLHIKVCNPLNVILPLKLILELSDQTNLRR
ncbi:MAG: hypothetical protein LEGION0398_MBIBDBAK_00096 [Legionellaceae bacterium]